jgi:hypothetical protein
MVAHLSFTSVNPSLLVRKLQTAKRFITISVLITTVKVGHCYIFCYVCCASSLHISQKQGGQAFLPVLAGQTRMSDLLFYFIYLLSLTDIERINQ